MVVSAIRAGCIMVSVLGSQWTFSVQSCLVVVLGVAIVGLGTLIIIHTSIGNDYRIEYSGWLGVPLGPAVLWSVHTKHCQVH